MAADRLGIPARKIEHATARVWRIGAPRMRPLAVGTAEGRALELGLRRHPWALAAYEGRRFGIAHVYRPARRQWDLREHATPRPAVAVAFPEQRMFATFGLDPLPVVRRPPLRIA